jgi:hypothetical protein
MIKLEKRNTQEFLPAARSSLPVRSVVGRLRAVGGVNNDSTFEVAEEIDFKRLKLRKSY